MCRVQHAKCQADWLISWIQDCWDYQHINNLRYADNTTLMIESKEELKTFLTRVKDVSEKAGLILSIKKLRYGIQSHYFMAISKKWKQWQILFSWAPKSLWMMITAKKLKDACCLKGKLWQKSRDITLLTKVHIVKSMVFPVVMHGCEIWTIQKAECQRIDIFEMGCWRRLLRVPWTAVRSNQSNLKEVNPEYSLEGLMLKLNSNTLATWCKELTHWKIPWRWERLKAKEDGGSRRWDA